MSTSINPESVGELPRISSGVFGPSDSSDSASDVTGTVAQAQGSDANGTGERRSVEDLPGDNSGADIEPDRIFQAPEFGLADVESDADMPVDIQDPADIPEGDDDDEI